MSDTTWLEVLGEPTRTTERLEGVVIGVLVNFDEGGAPLVDFPGNPANGPIVARMTAVLSGEDIGRDVALLFEGAEPDKPVLIGPVVKPHRPAIPVVAVDRDGETLELTADREIVLRCGKASITLTRAGKVIVRGTYVSSLSSGVNKIKGGAVHIN
jgi:uncharacterized protein DUF6484